MLRLSPGSSCLSLCLRFSVVTLWAPARGDLTLCVRHRLIHSVAVAPVLIPPGAVLPKGCESHGGACCSEGVRLSLLGKDEMQFPQG